MTKKLLASVIAFALCQFMLATDMIVKQKNGEVKKFNVEDVEEVIFNENSNIPNDSTVVDASEMFLRFKILSDTTAEVTKDDSDNDCSYLGHDSITIPEKVLIDGKVYTVTSIGERAFEFNKGLSSINIPEGVTSIGDWAFYFCGEMGNIKIPESVTSIGYGAFASCCSLASINIPKGVTSISTATFRSCNSLASIQIPENVTSIGSSAFHYCEKLASINIPNGVTDIESSVFSGCSSLASINIPNGVKSIGTWAFENCISLTSIYIPDGVKIIREHAFAGCDNLDIVIDNSKDNVNVGRSAFECKSVTWLKD